MSVRIKIYRAEPKGEGDELRLYISLTNGEEREDREAIVSAKQYFELGMPRDDISIEKYEAVEEAAEIWRAVKKGMEILLYGDNTRTRLKMKLAAHGFSRESAEGAAAYLEGMGLIDDEKIARRIFEYCLKKGYGPRRIDAELAKKGVGRELRDALDFDGVDFSRNCALVIKKKWGELPDDKKSRDKAVRSLLSLGYTYDHITEATRER